MRHPSITPSHLHYRKASTPSETPFPSTPQAYPYLSSFPCPQGKAQETRCPEQSTVSCSVAESPTSPSRVMLGRPDQSPDANRSYQRQSKPLCFGPCPHGLLRDAFRLGRRHWDPPQECSFEREKKNLQRTGQIQTPERRIPDLSSQTPIPSTNRRIRQKIYWPGWRILRWVPMVRTIAAALNNISFDRSQEKPIRGSFKVTDTVVEVRWAWLMLLIALELLNLILLAAVKVQKRQVAEF
jgi:hypothetical protein